MQTSSARANKDKRIVPLLLLADGLLAAWMALFSDLFGLDTNPGWGLSRILILTIAAALIALACVRLVQRESFGVLQSVEGSETTRSLFVLGHVWLILIIVYVWFVTYGNFTTWNRTTRYFDLLAESFRAGRLDVNANPGKGLLQSPNPYDPKTRSSFPDEIWDMSLYNGKLYYYWGPVPALAILPIQAIFHRTVTDNYIAFFFTVGLLVVNTLLLLKLRKLFFASLAPWVVLPGVLVAGLLAPILWNMSAPFVYAAAVCAGAFFMMGGITFTIAGLEDTPKLHPGWLFLAGTFLACTVGSRALQAISVIYIAALVLIWVWQHRSASTRRGDWIISLLAFFIPLALGALLIGWYNLARFESPFEFGLKYQITTYDLVSQSRFLFRLDYLPLNLRAYLIQPFERVDGFPFLRPAVYSDALRAAGVIQPYLYYGGRVTGLLFSAPFLLFSLIALAPRRFCGEPASRPFQKLVTALLAGTFAIGFGAILIYFNAQTRFLTDTISQFSVLAALGSWSLLQTKNKLRPLWAESFAVLVFLLALITVAAGLLIALTGETSRIEMLNPDLYAALRAFFR